MRTPQTITLALYISSRLGIAFLFETDGVLATGQPGGCGFDPLVHQAALLEGTVYFCKNYLRPRYPSSLNQLSPAGGSGCGLPLVTPSPSRAAHVS